MSWIIHDETLRLAAQSSGAGSQSAPGDPISLWVAQSAAFQSAALASGPTVTWLPVAVISYVFNPVSNDRWDT